MQRRRPLLSARVLLAALACAWAVAAAPARASERVREAVAASYVHGMTSAIAHQEVGTAAVPELLAMLRDPSTPRRDNVVAFLAYLGDERTPAALLASIEQPRTAEDERAVLLVPHALGVLARRGVGGALEPLLRMTEPQPAAPWLERVDADLRRDLLAQALNGLAWSGAPEARGRLLDVASSPEAQREAIEALALLDELRATSLEPAAGDPELEPAVDDPAARSHELGLTYANHVSLTNPMTDAMLDRVLRDASLHAARADFVEDVACCIRLARQGTRQTFGSPGDGLDVITTSQEIDRVLLNRVARVKVVRSIQYCSGPGTNILGCSLTPGNGMAVVRTSSLREEALLWLHELGHNVGLGHNNDRRYVMYPTLFTSALGLTGTECSRYHAPSSQAALTPRDIGACTDADGDDVASSADNCPAVPNRDQADANMDGVGDVCEADCTDDRDGDGVCDAQDVCPDTPDPRQDDADGDGRGDACDPCTDADADGYGDPASSSCPRGATRDCNDANPAIPAARDLCDGADGDCNGVPDDVRCVELDVTGDGRVDGAEMAWIGRAFGACSTTATWWRPVDYTADGCINGEDLAVLGAAWGCSGQELVCR